MTMVLDAQQVTLAINDRTLVQNVSFQLKKGKTLALVGESGSGKSLTALSIVRLLPEEIAVESGATIFYTPKWVPQRKAAYGEALGYNLFALSEKIVRSLRGRVVGFIFQEPASCLNPVMTIGEQIAEVIRIHTVLKGKAVREKTIFWLEKVGIPEAAERLADYPHQFSGGQKQRIMIAMALAGNPEVLIADEPTTALDVVIQAEILDLLKQLQQELQLTILLITHDLGVVQYVADELALMKEGQCILQTSVEDFFQSEMHPYAQTLAAAIPSANNRGHRLGEPLQAEPVFPDPPADSDTILQVQALSVAYPVRKGLFSRSTLRTVVSEVSFSVQRGHTLALVGASGCGKSTTAKALMQLLDRSVTISGDMTLEEKPASQYAPLVWRQSIQMIFQDPFASLNPRMRVQQLLEEGMIALCPQWNAAQRLERIHLLLDQVELPRNTLERFAHEFSGGQRQRIAIARALACAPKVLICDEPTSALDVTVQAHILNLLQTIQKQTGTAILLITHNFSIVEYCADRVVVMDGGKIVEYGSVEKVLQSPEHAVTQELLAGARKTMLQR